MLAQPGVVQGGPTGSDRGPRASRNPQPSFESIADAQEAFDRICSVQKGSVECEIGRGRLWGGRAFGLWIQPDLAVSACVQRTSRRDWNITFRARSGCE